MLVKSMAKKAFVTTSWDDGHFLDKQLVKLLDDFSLKGTFYIPKIEAINTLNPIDRGWLEKSGVATDSLGPNDVCKIDDGQEIGAHTLTHSNLSTLSMPDARNEIVGSKKYLEDILDHEVRMFCYPAGLYTAETKEIVKNAGFLGARTTDVGVITPPKNQFEFGTTIQVFPRPIRIKLHKTYALPQKSIFTWEAQVKKFFGKVLKKGGIFHIWGHSWEIEKLGMWDRLEKVFEHISNRDNVQYLTNGDCLEAINFKKP